MREGDEAAAAAEGKDALPGAKPGDAMEVEESKGNELSVSMKDERVDPDDDEGEARAEEGAEAGK